jgi:hypothetical protein
VLVALGIVVVQVAHVKLPALVYEWLFAIGWLLLALYFARRFGLRLLAFFRPPARRADWAFALIAVPLLALAATGLYLALYALSFVAPHFVTTILTEPDAAPLPGSALTKAFGALVPSAAGPVVEEVVFRGVLLNLWARRWGVLRAVLGTSVVFGLLHTMDPLSAFIFAIAMAALYIRTGSLLVPIAAHVLHNIVVALAQFGDDTSAASLADFRQDALKFAAIYLVSLLVVIVFLRLAIPRPWRLPPAFKDPQS